ncbi:hypothetical protein K1T71_001600 [Dendrolimus kikuchii]|uniref:Uncharacterized protein n=1 Tax=Dendrolimus kikuchii TaxID=765133 RepID=A0ACC1DEE5_9NEOP|nr:hypothetical protein K1T71_001600 [Dendrolimus kikuchii]
MGSDPNEGERVLKSSARRRRDARPSKADMTGSGSEEEAAPPKVTIARRGRSGRDTSTTRPPSELNVGEKEKSKFSQEDIRRSFRKGDPPAPETEEAIYGAATLDVDDNLDAKQLKELASREVIKLLAY